MSTSSLSLSMRLSLALLLGLLVTLGAAQSGSPDTQLTGIQCSEMACSDGWICQNSCSSWCGLDEPTEDRPVCNPKTDTGDAPPPTVPANRCDVNDCGFRHLDYVKCPEDAYAYGYAGTSCVRQSDGSCRWELADCQFAKTGPCDATTECPAEPAPESTPVECVDSNNVETGDLAHWECNRDQFGNCRWVWEDCPVGCRDPNMIDSFGAVLCEQFNPDSHAYNLANPPEGCNMPRNDQGVEVGESRFDGCGGCVYRWFVENGGPELCEEYTMNCNTILCKEGFRCFEGDVAGRPYCASKSTCENIRCSSGYGCEQTGNEAPICVKQPENFVLSCANIKCSSFHNCQNNADGLGVCYPFTGACADADCGAKKVCWDGSFVGDSCDRLGSGKCEWVGGTCPDEPDRPLLQPNGDRNCVAGQWSQWSCDVTCGSTGRETRTREIVQAKTGTGLECPSVIDKGDVCTGSPSGINCPPTTPTTPSDATCDPRPTCSEGCPSPLSGSQCINGQWRISRDVSLGEIPYVGCDFLIDGNLDDTSTRLLEVSGCATITVTGTATLSGPLAVDVYGVDITDPSRVVVLNAGSVIGSFSSIQISGLSPADATLPFELVHTSSAVFADFGTTGTTTPPTSTVGSTTSTAQPTTSTPTPTPTSTSGATPTPTPTTSGGTPTTQAPTSSSGTPTTQAPTSTAPTTVGPTPTPTTPIDPTCVYSEWSSYGDCQCGSGNQKFRTRQNLTPDNANCGQVREGTSCDAGECGILSAAPRAVSGFWNMAVSSLLAFLFVAIWAGL